MIGAPLNNFGVVNKLAKLDVPKNGMAITIGPTGEGDSIFDVGLYSNFDQDVKQLTERDKVIFLVSQGILKLTHENGEMLFGKGLELLNSFMDAVGKPVDLTDIKPEGTA